MPTSLFRNAILSSIAELLRQAGFRKSGAVLMREVNDVIHLTSLQSSTSSKASSLRLTVNIAIWVPALAEVNQQPDVWSSHWRERIGGLMPRRADHWWTVTSEPEAQVAAAEIRSAVEQFALPALAALETSTALAKLWESGASPGLTAFQAKRYLNRLHESAKVG
jgi:uncharacterized protein DUF4304